MSQGCNVMVELSAALSPPSHQTGPRSLILLSQVPDWVISRCFHLESRDILS